MAKYLNEEGLRRLWLAVKGLLNAKVDKVDGKDLSSNDFTDVYKQKIDSIVDGGEYIHPEYEPLEGKPENNQVPKFGESFTISQVVSDSMGHVSQLNDKTVKIPDDAMVGATPSKSGTRGLVPAPEVEDRDKFLRGDGTWAGVLSEDKRVGVVLDQTSKAYLIGVKETPTDTSQSVTAVSDIGVYLDTDAGTLHADKFAGSGESLSNIRADNITAGTISPNRLPVASTTEAGAMSASDKSKLDGFDSPESYAKKSDITSMYRHKGSVQTVADLPNSGNVEGDVYNVVSTNMNYVWIGTAWDPLGEIFTIVSISNSEIDNILRS